MRILGWEPNDDILLPENEDSLYGLIEDTSRFRSLRLSEDDMWAEVIHVVLGHTRWVCIEHLNAESIEVVYFDADPTFLPTGETNG